MWTHGHIGDVLTLIQNGVNCKQDKSGVGDKITRIETIADSSINYEKTGFAELDDKQKAKALLESGDILFSHINSPIHVGKTAIYDGQEPLFHGINLLRLRTIEQVDSSYFNMFLVSLFQSGYWKRTAKQSVNQASVNQTDIKSVPFSYPPLAEQQRIVAKLDAAFAEIDRAVDTVVEKAKQAALLRQSAIDNLVENSEVAVTTLRDAIEIKHGYAFRSEFFETVGEMVLLTPGNFEEAGGYRDRGEKQKYYVGECPSEFVLKGGDLLIAMTEQAKGLLGSPIIVPDDGIFLHNQRLGKVQPKKQLLLTWLFHYFNTSKVREQLHQSGTGLKVRHTSPTKISDLKIRIPPMDEQVKVASTLDSVITEQKRLSSHYQKLTEELIALKSAVLAQELQPPQSEAA